jgi:hypothetical protein
MKWFKKILWRWASEGQEIEECNAKISRPTLIAQDECDSPNGDPILNFKIYSAVGGKVVEFRQYDRHKDRNFHQTYIITNDQDFGERISKIATMEILKQ